jgi:hypothetical protein
MSHAPPALQAMPWRFFIGTGLFQRLHCLEYTSMPIMNDAHIWPFLHNCYLYLSEEPQPAVGVLALQKSKCKWDDLVVSILSNGDQYLTLMLAYKKCFIYT